MSEEGGSKRRKTAAETGGVSVADKAQKWAEEFAALGEDDQYQYLEELAPRMNKMHVQFLQGLMGVDDEEDEEEDFGEDDDDDDDDEEEEEADDDDDGA
eukprot:CAMPEP_0181223580 /NCGR_PEP_ID=MMETSP1096-20121128/30626_1 /TAXON_ID=156174 ORGANISM="Chrysochromulina ericina, Strain CCMP281" /NCGR_SAMPLE_ID=MMETSP1096 /ASSEMBLY_ACC=CAM_ASM_000453 /LENGTH=98 /DNA_ID=CAMNT_0023316519 /DNA_START=17 /DNA_END=313 /DNA_ORIENTATION=+